MKIFTHYKTVLKNQWNRLFTASLLLLLSTTFAFAQVELNTTTFMTNVEDEIVIAITPKNFEEIVSTQYTINWDPNVLQFLSLDDAILEGFGQGSYSAAFAETGELSIAWFDPDTQGETVDDGVALFTLTFKKLSAVPTELYFDGTPTPIEFIKFPFEEVYLNSTTNEVVVSGRLLEGSVGFDLNTNCAVEEDEKRLRNWLVEIDGPIKAFRTTNADGIFRAFLPFGDYTVKVITPQNGVFTVCEAIQSVSILEGAIEAVNIEFAAQPIVNCPSLQVEIGTPFLRRCFDNYYTVSYCNMGTEDAQNTYVTVELDKTFSYTSSSIPATLVEGNIYRFDLGTVAVNECGTFSIQVKVDCESTELGQTHCVKASIFPNTSCIAASDSWSGASLKLNSACEDDKVQFRIQNIGNGNMESAQDFIVIEDMILLKSDQQKSFQLQSGESYTVEYPANGSTYRLETKQVPNHPMENLLATAIEGCGINDAGTFSKGMINQFSAADENLFEDIDCRENIGAFDPNDKNAFPKGYQAPHYIEPNTELTYHIRFQNTGTDTAFNIVVLDTISDLLDVSTIIPLTSSHPYELEIVDSNILKYSFNNIMLPDSNINEAASHGFFKFKIQQQVDMPLGSVIENSAAIYFDFNEPVITNTFFHTLGIDFLEFRVITSTNDLQPLQLKVSPNPVKHTAIIKVAHPEHTKGQFLIYDLQGKKVGDYQFAGNEFQLPKGELQAGMYFFEVISKENLLGNGKLIIH